MRFEIARVQAWALRVEVDFAELGVPRRRVNSMCLVEVETRDGLTGYGHTSLSDSRVIAQAVNAVAGPAILGQDAMSHERVWQSLYWTLTGSGQSGFACHAISAIDLALWDIKGKALGIPVWRLLGGARNRLPVYATLGLPMMSRDELVEMAKRVAARGFKTIKMQVGRPGLAGGGEGQPLMDIVKDDIERIAAVREAIGPGVELAIDGACRFDLAHATEMARRAQPLDIAWYEEPLIENDPQLMAKLRRQTTIPLAAGQSEGRMAHFRDMMLAGGIDVIQPNVGVAGGITQCVKIAALAQALHVRMAGGGFHNMHVQAGLANGTKIEYQTSSARACEQVYPGFPKVENGSIALPEEPGLGLDPDRDAIADRAVALT